MQSERRIRHIESLLEQQRRIAAELEQVDDQTRRDVEDGLRHERAVTQMIAQSEPTTPPEYQDSFQCTSSSAFFTLRVTNHYQLQLLVQTGTRPPACLLKQGSATDQTDLAFSSPHHLRE